MDSTTKIPGYKILDKIGEGGMATVYLAVQVLLARTVALKIITPARLADPSAKERFLKEGKIIAKLNHPNIVTVHDIGHHESLYYMAIEYVGGGGLTKRIAQGLRPDEAIETTKQVAKALGYAHKHGFIHRDVKPANILFREDGTVVLSDFGIAKDTTSETVLTIMGATIGTPDYMSPEQLTGKRLDSRSDLYSIGVVLYEMLTCQKPFKGPDAFSTAICHLSSPVPLLPEQFALYQILIERLLAKDPNDRFDNAEQLIEALEHLSTDTTQRLAGDSKRTKRGTIWPKGITKSNNQAKSGNGDGGRAYFLRGFAVFGGLSLIIVAAVLWLKEPQISPQTQLLVDLLLSQAERQIAASRLTEPDGDNAYQSYQYVLKLNPKDKQAVNGLQKIADRFEQQALSKQRAARLGDALSLTARGLSVDPEHEGLLTLQKVLTQQVQKQRQQQKVARLLLQAEQQLKTSRLTQPAGENALHSYREVLGLDPQNRQALSGLQKIADRFQQLARSKLHEARPEEGLKLIAQGLAVVPQHKGLLALQQELSRQFETQQQQRTITQLLAQAERELNASQLMEPTDDNAYTHYRRILEIDPDNAKAKAGLVRIADQYEQIARQYQSQGAFQRSLAAIERGLEVAPAHQGLQNLRAEVADQIEERNRQQKEDARRKQELTHLLSLAGQQLDAGKLIEPPGNNAYESYQRIQSIDPRNASALKGLDKIATRIANNAQSERQQGRLKEGLSQVERGLKAFPYSARLQALRAELAQELGQQWRQQEIAALLTKAGQQFNTSKFTQPEDDNAYATYRSVLALDPQNRDALAGLQAIAKHHEELARRELDEGHSEKALLAIAEGLKADKENESLIRLRLQIKQRLEDQAHRERRLYELQAKAQTEMAAARYTEPEGDNAYETFQQILALDAGHAEALAGLARIAGVFEQRARENRRNGNYQKSLSLIDKALEVQPQHRELITLRQAVEVQLEKQRQKQKIDNLLAKANHQFTASRLTQPEGDNALESYRQVLKLSPNNERALAGIQRIADRHLQLAQTTLEQGKLSESLALIEKGLTVAPWHTDLQSLRDTVTRQLQGQQRQEKLEGLLAAAKEQFAASWLTTPKGNNAYETYTQVLQLSPQDKRALDGLQHIAERYLQLGQSQFRQGDLNKSLVFCDRGLTVDPKHSELLALRAEIQHRHEVETQLRQTLRPLLAKASQQLAALHLTEPEGDNAHETYLQVLEMDEDNQQAENGLQKIADSYQTFAKNKQRSGDPRGGLKLAELGLTVNPAHPGLLRLHQEIISALNEKIQNERKIEHLFEIARQKLEAGHFIRPPGNNASAIYRQILAIDPQNPRAQEGLQTITEYCMARAQVMRQDGDLQQSLSLVQQGLEITPNHPGLLSLQNSLTHQLESAEHEKRYRIFGTH
jgi:serine/threonine-protein kinase PpkA